MAMPLGRGIVEVFEAIPERIEVSGHGPTWKVTGGSFDDVLDYARAAFGETAVIAREDRGRWWPRVTLTVTKDPALMTEAPALETFAEAAHLDGPEPRRVARADASTTEDESEVTVLEEIFAYQEERRLARRGIPEQRSSR
jgi:hypothetical protein